MRNKTTIILAAALALATAANAQKDKTERREDRQERTAANQEKVDYTVFRRQILTLPEYSQQRRELAEMKKTVKGVPKVSAVVDSLAEPEDGKTLIGYIVASLGDNSVNTYEVVYDRRTKKIVQVRPTGEKLELDEDDRRPGSRQPSARKKSGDDDDEEEDEKPSKRKPKEEEEDD